MEISYWQAKLRLIDVIRTSLDLSLFDQVRVSISRYSKEDSGHLFEGEGTFRKMGEYRLEKRRFKVRLDSEGKPTNVEFE